LLPPWKRAIWPDGYYDVGVAHGVPGVIALLGLAHAAGVRPQGAGELLEQTVAWVLSHRVPGAPGSRLPSIVPPNGTGVFSRTAWCYGDLGAAAALLVAARGVGEVAWEREARALARSAVARRPEKTGVRDAGLCHGASGLGHLFNRMFQATGDEALGDAARSWIGRALSLRQPGQGIAGFLTLEPDVGDGERWEVDASFLTGAAGIALVLLAATSDVEPEWDRLLLLSSRAGLASVQRMTASRTEDRSETKT
jgi:hypothetical protein